MVDIVDDNRWFDCLNLLITHVHRIRPYFCGSCRWVRLLWLRKCIYLGNYLFSLLINDIYLLLVDEFLFTAY